MAIQKNNNPDKISDDNANKNNPNLLLAMDGSRCTFWVVETCILLKFIYIQ